MTSKITNNLRILNANQFLNLFSITSYDEWTSGTAYVAGDIVRYGIYKYIAQNSGTSGVNPPTHVSGVQSDDVVDWQFVEITYDLTYFKNNIYIGAGKTDVWYGDLASSSAWVSAATYTIGDIVGYSGSYYLSLTDHTGETTTPDLDATNWTEINAETPIDPENDFEHMYDYLDNLIAIKKLTGNNIRYGIERHDWTSGVVYSAFDPSIDDFNYPGNSFFVVADTAGTKRVYKCLDNAGGAASTDKPTGESSGTIRTTDNYLWKYMGVIEDDEFLTTNYAPVVYKNYNDSSTQWITQSLAQPNSLSNIKVTAGGTGYNNSSVVTIGAPDLTDGIQATATLQTTGGVIDYIELTNVGSGYVTAPSVSIADGSGATVEVVMAPKDGNSSNILKELNARYAIIKAEFNDTESGYFPVDGENDFRQIMLVMDPKDWDQEVCTATLYIGMENNDYKSSFPAWTALTSYVIGDAVTYNSVRYVCNTDHTSTSTWSDNATKFDEAKLQTYPGSGTLLYVDNLSVVTRAPGQIEDVKIILKF